MSKCGLNLSAHSCHAEAAERRAVPHVTSCLLATCRLILERVESVGKGFFFFLFVDITTLL